MKLSHEIIELFEDFIEEHGGLVNNPERDEAIASRQDDPDCIAHIYGIDYGNLQDELELLLECSGVDMDDDIRLRDLCGQAWHDAITLLANELSIHDPFTNAPAIEKIADKLGLRFNYNGDLTKGKENLK